MATRLDQYLAKRDLKKSGEPKGGKARKGAPLFVIQQHDASRMHFDFRLEVDGVLASWAVPKGPSTDPRERRMAIRTEDHPLDYASFEGVIPEGEYGAGAVIVWDAGTFDNAGETDLTQGLRDGHIVVDLHGSKLHGGYALTRMRSGDDEQWLLVKTRDDAADARRNPVSTEPKSVLSGKTVDDMERSGDGDDR